MHGPFSKILGVRAPRPPRIDAPGTNRPWYTKGAKTPRMVRKSMVRNVYGTNRPSLLYEKSGSRYNTFRTDDDRR